MGEAFVGVSRLGRGRELVVNAASAVKRRKRGHLNGSKGAKKGDRAWHRQGRQGDRSPTAGVHTLWITPVVGRTCRFSSRGVIVCFASGDVRIGVLVTVSRRRTSNTSTSTSTGTGSATILNAVGRRAWACTDGTAVVGVQKTPPSAKTNKSRCDASKYMYVASGVLIVARDIIVSQSTALRGCTLRPTSKLIVYGFVDLLPLTHVYADDVLCV